MKALILAGGLGTRLRPLTLTRPKHLLPIVNRPHIEHVLDLLQRYGIHEAVLLTSYLAEAFAAVLEAGRQRGMVIEVTHEPVALGTAGALKNAQHLVGDSAFLVFNGDVLFDVDLARVAELHKDRAAEATIVLTPVEDPSAYGVVPTDDEGRVQGFIEKPPAGTVPTNLINAGVYVLEPTVLDRIPSGVVWSAERQLFPQLVEDGARLFASGTDAYWIDIGTPQKYLQANLDALSGAFPSKAAEAARSNAVVADVSCEIAPDARVSSVCCGAGVTIGGGATLRESVLLRGVRVEEGASVRRSVLGEDVVVGRGAVVVGETLGDGERV